MSKVAVGKMDISVDFQRVLEFQDDSEILISQTDTLERKFKDSDVEVFHRKDNILVTEAGYYVTAFESKLKEKGNE